MAGLTGRAEHRTRHEVSTAGLEALAVTWDHGLAVRGLADPHVDDHAERLEGLTIVANDEVIRRHEAEVLRSGLRVRRAGG